MMRVPASKNRVNPNLAVGRAMIFSASLHPFFAADITLLAVLVSILFFAASTSADPARFVQSPTLADDILAESDLHPLGDLLSVPADDYVWVPESTDEALATAVIHGNDPDLERRNPFRKRNLDLFRTERPLVIGQNEMLLRLRLRPKTSKLMSVELHF